MRDGRKRGNNPTHVQTHTNKMGRLQSQQPKCLYWQIYNHGKSMAKGKDLFQDTHNMPSCRGAATDTHHGAASTTPASSLHMPRLINQGHIQSFSCSGLPTTEGLVEDLHNPFLCIHFALTFLQVLCKGFSSINCATNSSR